MTPLSEEMLSAYVDGECTPEEAHAVEAKVAAEPRWNDMLADVRAARDALRSLPMRELPPDFVDALLAPVPSRRSARVGAGLVAAAAVIVGFALAIPRDAGSSVTPPVATLAETHGATASLDADPVSTLAPVVVPVGLEP